MSSSYEPEKPSEPIRFRPSKKRKNFRQRAGSEDESQTPEPRSARRRTAADYFDQSGKEDDEPTVVRAAARHAKRGFGFRAHARPVENEERGLVVREEQKPVEDRFVKAASGRTVVDDRHIAATPAQQLEEATPGGPGEEPRQGTEKRTEKHGNQIQEVDLPPAPDQGEQKKPERPKKVRLGPDGKLWRGGRRKRRGSDDVARDKMVEELLHENRLDVYDHPAQPTAEDADGDADERIAAQFRQQYLEDVARKQQKQKAAQQKQKEEGEVLKGPKLGGSRNDRAAVREALLRNQRGGK